MTLPQLILASASPSRERLLRSAGLHPQIVVSGVPEDDVQHLSPEDQVAELAQRKARAVSELDSVSADSLIIGADSLFLLDGTVFGKPGTASRAHQRWQQLRGREGHLITGHCVMHPHAGTVHQEVVSTPVHFASVSDEEIAAYVNTGEPLEVAGAFMLEGRAALFINRIEGDPSNVMGLSLPTLYRLLQAVLSPLGLQVTDYWNDQPSAQ